MCPVHSAYCPQNLHREHLMYSRAPAACASCSIGGAVKLQNNHINSNRVTFFSVVLIEGVGRVPALDFSQASVSLRGAGSHTVEVLEYSRVTPQLISKDTRLNVTLKMNVAPKITSNMQKVATEETLLQASFKNVFIIMSL